MGPSFHYVVPTLYFSLLSTLLCPVASSAYPLLYSHTQYSYSLSGLMLAMGVCSFLGQSFNNKAYSYEKAAKVAAMNYFEIVFGFLASALLFGSPIRVSDIVAALLIVSCTFIMAMVKCCR